ncbi:hypothetical protein [Polaromonas sp.]|nr:hypothetical protein [Polaromonas sp.]
MEQKPKSTLIQAAELNTKADAAMDVQSGLGLAAGLDISPFESKT